MGALHHAPPFRPPRLLQVTTIPETRHKCGSKQHGSRGLLPCHLHLLSVLWHHQFTIEIDGVGPTFSEILTPQMAVLPQLFYTFADGL